MRRKLEELDLIDDFMMNGIANDERVGEKFFRKLLSVLLEQDIGQVKVTAQRTIPALDTAYRGVRLDVEVQEVENENGTERVAKVYDIEPHLRNDTDFPKSNRHGSFVDQQSDLRNPFAGGNRSVGHRQTQTIQRRVDQGSQGDRKTQKRTLQVQVWR